jgi:DNA-binding NarL/FixJ family response regulator/class 3 adenylate cyclase
MTTSFVALVVTDLVDSTALRVAIGEDAYDDLRADHDRLVGTCVTRSHGTVAKHTGDGVMATFIAASDALLAAERIQQAIERRNRDATHALAVRVGVSAGDVSVEDNDYFGTPPVEAARLCAAADGGHVLVADVVRTLAGSRGGHVLTNIGTPALKGLPPMTVWELEWLPADNAERISVVVADDVALVRSGVARLLASEGFDVAAEAADYDSLIAAVDAHRPQLVITDIRMPPTNTDEGLRAAAHLKAQHPGMSVLVLSQYVEASAAAELLDGQTAGTGYLLKERVTELDEFVAVVRRVVNGESVIDPLVAEQLIARRRHDDVISSLTERECSVLALMAQGFSNAAIANQLFVSSKTVETHVRSIFTKLDLVDDADGNRRVQAVIRWLQSPQ